MIVPQMTDKSVRELTAHFTGSIRALRVIHIIAYNLVWDTDAI